MPEQLEKLRATIEDLEDELNSLTTIDAETRGLLQEALSEIQAAIHKQDPAHIEGHSLSGKLTRAAERFESTHPTLSGIVSRVVDMLAQMGI